MKGENLQKKIKTWKNGHGLMVLVLINVLCLGPILHTSQAHDSTLTQRLHASGSWDLKDPLLGYFTPSPNYLLSTAGTFLKSVHFSAISDYGFQLSRPSLANLIESTHGKFYAAVSVASMCKVRAPPLLLSDRAIQ